MQGCSICRRSEASAIAAALIAGDSVRVVAAKWNVSKSAVHRHLMSCLAEQVAAARREGKGVAAAEIVARLAEITSQTMEVLEAMRSAGDWAGALRAIARLERQLRLEGEIAGELETGATTNVLALVQMDQHPEWIRIRTAMLRALERFPEARSAVVVAIDTREAA